MDVDGFVLATKELRLELAEWRVKETFEEFDTDGNGSLDFEEFVELAAMKIVEKWAVKGGRAFLSDDNSGAANAIKTNAKRQLSVGEIMGEVMDNKANEEYSSAKARFHVEEVLLIEEAFISLAQPPSRRGKVKTMKLKEFTVLIGINAREHDLAVLAAEADPLDTRSFALPEVIIALAKLQDVWRKVDGQLHDFRSDQETLSDELVIKCNNAFKRSVRKLKFKSDGVPLMECRMVASAFRLLGFVIDPSLANLWVMELHLGHDAAAVSTPLSTPFSYLLFLLSFLLSFLHSLSLYMFGLFSIHRTLRMQMTWCIGILRRYRTNRRSWRRRTEAQWTMPHS